MKFLTKWIFDKKINLTPLPPLQRFGEGEKEDTLELGFSPPNLLL
jgi:hypothetical protein